MTTRLNRRQPKPAENPENDVLTKVEAGREIQGVIDNLHARAVKDGRVRVELAHQAAGFELYYSMGANRTLAEVARQMGVSYMSVSTWCKRYKWKDRVKERDALVEQGAIQKTTGYVTERRIVYSQEIDRLVNNFFASIQALQSQGSLMLKQGNKNGGTGKATDKPSPFIFIKNVDDLEKLIKLGLLLTGHQVAPGTADATPESGGAVPLSDIENIVENKIRNNKELQANLTAMFRQIKTVANAR